MEFLKKLSRIDRRVLYLLLTVVVILPLIFPMDVRQHVDQSTLGLFEAIDRIQPNNKAVLISFDYAPDVAAELDPMAVAVLRHCFAKDIRVIGMALSMQGAALGERVFASVAQEYGKKSGTDYVYQGYRLGISVILMSMGENIKKAFPADYYGVPFDSLPMMRNIRNYQDMPVVLSLAGSGIIGSWIFYAGTRYGANIASGVTAVMAPDNYPYLQTGQLIGQLGGMKGAAEYEQLIVEHGYYKKKDMASRAMNAISGAHILLIVLIVLGNIAYFASLSDRKKA